MDYSSDQDTVKWLTMASIIASLGDTAQGDFWRVGDIAEIGHFTSSVMSLMFRRWSIETRSSPQIAHGDRDFTSSVMSLMFRPARYATIMSGVR